VSEVVRESGNVLSAVNGSSPGSSTTTSTWFVHEFVACALSQWSLEDIVSDYCVSKAERIKNLLVLERMGLADLKAGNRIRLLVARDFDWLPDGPLRGFFLRLGLPDFMASRFDVPDETLHFAHGMLTKPAYAQLQVEIHKLRSKLAALHNESLSAPLSEKRGTALLLAMRVWEPQVFRKLKRR
jgi:hypothetical protein